VEAADAAELTARVIVTGLSDRDGLNFNQAAEMELRRDGDGARGTMVAQYLRVNSIDDRPVGDVRHINSHAHEFVEPRTGSLEYTADIAQNLARLCLYACRNRIIAAGDKRKLPGHKDESVCRHGLAVMAARLRPEMAADVSHRCFLFDRKMSCQEVQKQLVELIRRIET
jgi:hypothetical protein